MNIKTGLSISWILVLAACASRPPVPTVPVPAPTTTVTLDRGELSTIDLTGIQNRLGMTRPAEQLGFDQEDFNTCEVGYGFSSTQDCRTLKLAVIHFRLQCRQSEGTVSHVSSASLTPIHSNSVKWKLGATSGETRTNSEGYGRIVTIASKSLEDERLRISVGGQFLVISAGEARRIVTPSSWCI